MCLPAYAGVKGNKRADSLARKGTVDTGFNQESGIKSVIRGDSWVWCDAGYFIV